MQYFLDVSLELGGRAGKKAELGSLCHRVYEVLAKCRKSNHHLLNDKYCDSQYILDICWKRWQKTHGSIFDFTEDDYEFCQKTVAMICDTKWHPFNFDIKYTELQFELELDIPGFKGEDGKNCLLRGTIDLVVEEDKDTLRVIDYKTGKRLNWVGGGVKEYPDFMKDIQLQVYDIALSTLFPQYKTILLTLHFVRDGGPFTVTYTPEDRKKAIYRLRRIFNSIKSDDSYKRLKDDSTRRSEIWKCKYVCYWGMNTDEHGTTLCDKFHRILKTEDIETAEQKIIGITVAGRGVDLSRRNDYSRANIHKGKVSV
jgi:hypothetical protein